MAVQQQGPAEDHRVAELKSIAKSIVTVFPDQAATLRAIAVNMESEAIDGD